MTCGLCGLQRFNLRQNCKKDNLIQNFNLGGGGGGGISSDIRTEIECCPKTDLLQIILG